MNKYFLYINCDRKFSRLFDLIPLNSLKKFQAVKTWKVTFIQSALQLQLQSWRLCSEVQQQLGSRAWNE